MKAKAFFFLTILVSVFVGFELGIASTHHDWQSILSALFLTFWLAGLITLFLFNNRETKQQTNKLSGATCMDRWNSITPGHFSLQPACQTNPCAFVSKVTQPAVRC